MPTSISDSVRPAPTFTTETESLSLLVTQTRPGSVGSIATLDDWECCAALARAKTGRLRRQRRDRMMETYFSRCLGAGTLANPRWGPLGGEPGRKSLTYLRYRASAGSGGPWAGRKAAPRRTRSSPQPGSKGVRLLAVSAHDRKVVLP